MTYESYSEPFFYKNVIIDVTYLDAKEGDSLGYLCGCDICVYPNGYIHFSNASKELEKLHISEIILASDNINNYDPMYTLDISITTERRKICITFDNIETKSECWKVLEKLHKSKS